MSGSISKIRTLNFSISEGHIAHVYYAFARLCKGIGDDCIGAKQLLEFNRILVDKSLEILHSIIFHPVDGSGEVPSSLEK